ncbi:hypothetical protein D3C84_939280 [compost metagenome]
MMAERMGMNAVVTFDDTSQFGHELAKPSIRQRSPLRRTRFMGYKEITVPLGSRYLIAIAEYVAMNLINELRHQREHSLPRFDHGLKGSCVFL